MVVAGSVSTGYEGMGATVMGWLIVKDKFAMMPLIRSFRWAKVTGEAKEASSGEGLTVRRVVKTRSEGP